MGVNYFKRDDRDARFVLFEHIGVEKLLEYEAYKDFDRDDLSMILDEGLKFAREVMGPTMQDGDQEGCVYDNGEVRVAESFHQAWKLMAENGWLSLPNNPEFGGQGLPLTMAGQIMEYFAGANISLLLYAGLVSSGGHLLETFGTDEDRKLFLEKMYTGVWGGAMCHDRSRTPVRTWGGCGPGLVPDPRSDDPQPVPDRGDQAVHQRGVPARS